MIGYVQNGWRVEPPEPEALQMMSYRDHVANGTVPKKGIPYTRQGKVKLVIPGDQYVANPAMYIRQFNLLNNLKEF